MLVAGAGPASNLLLALVGAGAQLVPVSPMTLGEPECLGASGGAAGGGVQINVLLAVFNMP